METLNAEPQPDVARPMPQNMPETQDTEVKLSAQDIRFFYGNFEALKGISIEIPKNRITAFIGPSGCGKSTFLRCMNRMNDLIDDTRIEGKLLLDGQDINSPNVDVVALRKRVGMVFQRPNPFPMSIYDNIAYGPRIHGTKDKRKLDEIVETSLQRAFLWEYVKDKLKQSGTQLSGGQQQRLCIARVLSVDPDVILMDEPASALDPVASSKIEDLMLELRDHYTVVIVTHNMQQAQRASDFTGFFLLGELIEYQETSSLFLTPQKKQTEDYISGRFG